MRVAALCAGLMMLVSTTARAEVDAPRLTVRLYKAVALGVSDLAEAQRTAEPVLREAGIDVHFRYCGMPHPVTSVVDRCDQRLRTDEVVVRIIDAPRVSTVSPLAYGVTYVLNTVNQGWLATVFADRVSAGAVRLRVDGRALLGLVIAHEVGHLLLGEEHSLTGLMSATWHDADLRRPATTSSWHFSANEAEAIQERLQDR